MKTHTDLFARACAVSPGGVQSPVRAFGHVGGSPVFFSSGAGAFLTDVTGRRYIDFCMSFGPLILGHAHPEVAEAAHAAIDDGWSFGACEPYSLALAEWIVAQVPWAERIRFVSSGTEATMSALRVARAATGRPYVLKFEGCYHGHADALLVQAGSGLAGVSAASSAGVGDVASSTLVAPLDDVAALEAVFAVHGPSIAAVILEPLPANYGLLPQQRAWHEAVARLCKAGHPARSGVFWKSHRRRLPRRRVRGSA
jgi:glutamate-1-semialdehyde 2,1-aminomutase